MIRAEGVGYAYGETVALEGVSLTIEDGEHFAVMGANGAGKSTLLRVISGLDEPTAGSIEGGGVVGFSPEDPSAALFADTVADEVAFFPRNRGLDAAALTDAALRDLDIEGLRDRQPRSLSAGEQRAVAIAAVLAGDPDVLALDEPTAGLDRRGERDLERHLEDLDSTMVVATHASDFAYEFADRVAVLADGRVERVGPPGDVLTDDELLAECGIRLPGVVEWARARGYGDERLPSGFDAAVGLARSEEEG